MGPVGLPAGGVLLSTELTVFLDVKVEAEGDEGNERDPEKNPAEIVPDAERGFGLLHSSVSVRRGTAGDNLIKIQGHLRLK